MANVCVDFTKKIKNNRRSNFVLTFEVRTFMPFAAIGIVNVIKCSGSRKSHFYSLYLFESGKVTVSGHCS